MRGDYTHFGNDLVQSVTYGNLASTWYTFDEARRVAAMEHRNASGGVILRLAYTYYNNDLPWTITESGISGSATTWFYYDHRRRLTDEQRLGTNPYILGYAYDAGGNRTKKIDYSVDEEVDYTYDTSDPSGYGSNNNRLEMSRKFDMTQPPIYPGDPWKRLSTTWYYYTLAGNVERVVTREEAPGGVQQSAAAASSSVGAQGGTVGTTVENGVEAMALPGGTGCTDPLQKYTATRFGYAKNGATVTYVLGERWCWDGDSACEQGGSYTVTYAREFRYDSARARYMNRKLNPSTLATVSTTWSDYDGDEVYGDFEMVSGSPVNKRSFEPGIGRTTNALTTPVTDYYHGDMLGTTRLMSNSSGSSIEPAVYTAFGERITGPTTSDATRYGYVGAWGYQSHTDFPYLHVGARYYDPSSGRFLQRDPIGIAGGRNVYSYVLNTPTRSLDPRGLFSMNECVGYCGCKGLECVKKDPKNPGQAALCLDNQNKCIVNCKGKVGEVDNNWSGDPGPPPYPNPNDPDQWDPWPGVDCGGGGGASGAAAGTLFALFSVRFWRGRHRSGRG